MEILLLPAASPAVAASKPAASIAVEKVLRAYKDALERLDPSGTEPLFARDSQIFESGGSEGTYVHYLEHHLKPEFGEFRSFRFEDYRIDVRFEGPLALATETYRYRIETKAGESVMRLGVTTSVLRRAGADWKIVSLHSSSRKPPSS